MHSDEMKVSPNNGLKAYADTFTRKMRAILRRAPMFVLQCALVAAATQIAAAQTESVLYAFCSMPDCADGRTPAPDLLLNAQGNLYGTAAGGAGSFAGGVIFKLNPGGDAETLLYEFGALQEGLGPNGGLIQDSAGNFYGTTAGGGYDKNSCKRLAGCGLLYKLSDGTETVLYNFLGGKDGDEPNGSLVLDQAGNLYGTTYAGGSIGGHGGGNGTIFEVSSAGTETVLHRFGAAGEDGKFPNAGLVRDTKGNFYGTTISGGVSGYDGPGSVCDAGCGVVFKLTAAGVETVLYAFKGAKKGDGAAPFSGLILDGKGNLYGTTYAGGAYGQGTVFKLTPAGEETVLHSFSGPPDGAFPVGNLVMDGNGNLYGTTSFGGTHNKGTVFELTKSNSEKQLYSFPGGADGRSPLGALVMDAEGNLYGTTFLGGNFNTICVYGCGVVFKVTP